MDRQQQIRQGLQKFASQHGPLQTILAQVVSVDEAEGTCTLDDEGVAIYEVRLKPVLTADESVVMLPAVDSMVLIGRIEEDDEWLLLACEKVDKYRITSSDCVIEMDAEGISIKKENESLKSILDDLIDAINSLTVPTNVGPSGVPLNSVAFTDIKTRISNFLK